MNNMALGLKKEEALDFLNNYPGLVSNLETKAEEITSGIDSLEVQEVGLSIKIAELQYELRQEKLGLEYAQGQKEIRFRENPPTSAKVTESVIEALLKSDAELYTRKLRVAELEHVIQIAVVEKQTASQNGDQPYTELLKSLSHVRIERATLAARLEAARIVLAVE